MPAAWRKMPATNRHRKGVVYNLCVAVWKLEYWLHPFKKKRILVVGTSQWVEAK